MCIILRLMGEYKLIGMLSFPKYNLIEPCIMKTKIDMHFCFCSPHVVWHFEMQKPSQNKYQYHPVSQQRINVCFTTAKKKHCQQILFCTKDVNIHWNIKMGKLRFLIKQLWDWWMCLSIKNISLQKWFHKWYTRLQKQVLIDFKMIMLHYLVSIRSAREPVLTVYYHVLWV